jgi:hypothetical protein
MKYSKVIIILGMILIIFGDYNLPDFFYDRVINDDSFSDYSGLYYLFVSLSYLLLLFVLFYNTNNINSLRKYYPIFFSLILLINSFLWMPLQYDNIFVFGVCVDCKIQFYSLYFGVLLLFIGTILNYFKESKLHNGRIVVLSDSIKNEPFIENKITIPETCPHCKNPNTKKIILCEWCGNQII